jgi:hypothetical protein
MSDPFRITLARQPTFHGKVSTDRADRGFDNYLILAGAGYQLRILLNGKEHLAVTADPVVGIIEFYQGDRLIGLQGQVEVRLDRRLRT